MSTLPTAFSLTPTNLGEALKFSEMIANSDIVPKDFKGKAGNVLVAIQMGQEIGLQPMQALQNIAVINGRPCVWGDSLPALAKRHRHYEYMAETWDETAKVATCKIKRKNEPEHVVTFSWEDAVRAGLSNRDTYKNYPQRMLQMRARSWAVRDVFPDAFRGLYVAEEAHDIPPDDPIDVTPRPASDNGEAPRTGAAALEAALTTPAKEANKTTDGAAAPPNIDESTGEVLDHAKNPGSEHGKNPEGSLEWYADRFNNCVTIPDLEKIGLELNALDDSEDKDTLRTIYKTRWHNIVEENSKPEDDSDER